MTIRTSSFLVVVCLATASANTASSATVVQDGLAASEAQMQSIRAFHAAHIGKASIPDGISRISSQTTSPDVVAFRERESYRLSTETAVSLESDVSTQQILDEALTRIQQAKMLAAIASANIVDARKIYSETRTPSIR